MVFLGDMCDVFTGTTVSVLRDGKRLWFGKAYDLPEKYSRCIVWLADATPRRKYRNNQTDVYIFLRND